MKHFYLCLAIFFCTVAFSSCNSCNTSTLAPYNDNISNKETDSVIRANKDSGALDSLVRYYDRTRNDYGYIAANKQLGKNYRIDGDFYKSISYHNAGMERAIQICDTLNIIDELNNIGTNYRRLGILDEASSYHYNALTLCQEYSDKESYRAKKNQVISLNGLGNIFLTIKNTESADSLFRMALAGEKELGSWLGQAINYANIGSIYETRGLIDSARIYYAHSMDCNKKADSDLGIALCHTHFGRLYEKERRWDKAIKEYSSAYDLMLANADKWHWLEACLSLANVLITKGEYSKGIEYIDKAKVVAEELESTEHLAQVYRLYSVYFNAKGDYKNALDNYKISQEYEDLILNESDKNFIYDQRIKFITQKKQSEIDNLQSNYDNERKVKRILAYLICLLLFSLVLVIVSFIYIIRIKEKNRKLLAKAEDARRAFFTNITHEFRTPLTVILGLSEKLSDGKIGEEESVEDIGKMITRQGNNLLMLINQLLDITKVKSAINDPDWYRGNIVSYTRMICDNCRQLAQMKHIELTFSSAQNEIVTDFVPDYLNKVIQNLLSNAFKFTDEYGKVKVELSQKEGILSIIVSDTGKGIDHEELSHIFDSFYQSKNSHNDLGSGIGLCLVNMIVKSINGQISVTSRKNIGTTFNITIPLHENSVENAKIFKEEDFILNNYQPRPIDTTLKNKSLPQGKKMDSDNENDKTPIILIIEDNTDIAYYIGSVLKDDYRLFYAVNGIEGLKMAEDLVPDIIISDLMMPEMDGYELCEKIRSSDLVNHIPIIIITAKSSEDDKIRSLEAGADAYLIKPFNSEELNIRVSNLLESRALLRRKYSRAIKEGNEECVPISDSDQKFLTQVIDITYNMMRKGGVNVTDLADKLNMSAKQLNRKIFAITGENTSTYIIRIRLSKAMKMLDTHQDMPIGDIAMECGFEDSAYFSRIFKKMLNITPSQYRRRVK